MKDLFLNLVFFFFLPLFFGTSSADCQTSDWKSGHKLKCKVFRSTDSSPVGRDDVDYKASLFGNMSASKKSKIALVPQLSQSKAALKPTDVMVFFLVI